MLEKFQRRNYSEGTIRAYLQAVQQFAVQFGIIPVKPSHAYEFNSLDFASI